MYFYISSLSICLVNKITNIFYFLLWRKKILTQIFSGLSTLFVLSIGSLYPPSNIHFKCDWNPGKLTFYRSISTSFHHDDRKWKPPDVQRFTDNRWTQRLTVADYNQAWNKNPKSSKYVIPQASNLPFPAHTTKHHFKYARNGGGVFIFGGIIWPVQGSKFFWKFSKSKQKQQKVVFI